MSLWLTIIAAGLVTYATRASFIALGERLTLPVLVERALRYVAPAAFAAISAPLVFRGGETLANDLPRLVAASAACIVVWKLRSVPLSLLAGMGTLWLLMWMF